VKATKCDGGEAVVERKSGGTKEILADLNQTWRLIAVMLSMAVLLSFIWIIVLRYLGMGIKSFGKI
jgi:hypothetical protein